MLESSITNAEHMDRLDDHDWRDAVRHTSAATRETMAGRDTSIILPIPIHSVPYSQYPSPST